MFLCCIICPPILLVFGLSSTFEPDYPDMNKRFQRRSFISFGLFLSFLLIAISGIVLYIAPPGRIARWQEWHLLGLDRSQWEDQHTLFSYLFIILAVVHLFSLNWKAFLSYLRQKVKSKTKQRKDEIKWATLLVLVVFLLTLFKIPPVYTVIDLGAKASDTWSERRGGPPIPHAEELSIAVLAKEILQAEPDSVILKLQQYGFAPLNEDELLNALASRNAVSPAVVFDSLRKDFPIRRIPGIAGRKP